MSETLELALTIPAELGPATEVMRNGAFVDDYADARVRWRDGVATAFPAGTYWLQRFASVPILRA
jgi:hypothetical protein